MLGNGTYNRGFHNWRACPHPRHLYGGFPSNIHYLSPLVGAYKSVCYICQYAHAWFVRTHTSHQTLSMLAPQRYLETQPFSSPPLILIILLKQVVSSSKFYNFFYCLDMVTHPSYHSWCCRIRSGKTLVIWYKAVAKRLILKPQKGRYQNYLDISLFNRC